MFRRLTKLLKRAEMATDLMVLEKAPDSARAAEIRAKYKMQELENSVRLRINEDVERINQIVKNDRK